MTPQEKQLLEGFLADMVAARSGAKDADAEALIREAISRQPDAAYLLVQRAIQLDQALQLTQAEVRKLETEVAQARAGGDRGGSSFLGDAYAWGSRAAGDARAGAGQRAANPAALGQPAPGARPLAGGWGGSGMLGTLASTAAGVVAGSFLFQGIQNLMNRDDASAPASASAPEQHAQGIGGDSTGFEEVVPDETDLFAGGGDDGDVA